MLRFLFPLTLFLAACSTSGEQRFVIDPPAEADRVRVSVGTIEVRDVTLPGHASGSDLLIQTETGGLVKLGDAIWADEPQRAITGSLTEALNSGSTATAAASPWPLFERPDAQVEVRLSRMLARADGVFTVDGQVAISSSEIGFRERIEAVSIAVPLTEITAEAIADATGRAIDQLAAQIIGYLR